MAKTLTILRAEVRTYLDEAAQHDFLDTEINREINYAYQDVASEVMEVYESFYHTTTPKTLSTVALQQEYNLDTTLLKVTRVELKARPSDPNAVFAKVTPIKLSEIPTAINGGAVVGGSATGYGYYIHGNQDAQMIGFTPIPQESGTDNIKTWGIETPAELTDDAHTVKIPYPERFAKLIVLRAAASLLRKGQQDESSAKEYDNTYYGEISRMKTFLKERQEDGVLMIEESEPVESNFDSWI